VEFLKITVINGSPHKGNTFQLIKQIEASFQQKDNVTFSYIHLFQANLKTCLGCFQCIRKGHDNCPLVDDKKQILDELLSSDGIILASPAYNYNVTSIMKNFIDRFAFIGHRPMFFKQHLLIISSTAGIGLRQVNSYLSKYVGNIWGFRSVLAFGYVKNPNKELDEIFPKIKRKIENISTAFYNHIINNHWKPNFHHIDQFCTMRMLWTLEKMRNAFPYDFTYYSSLKGKHFYFEVKINTIQYNFALTKAKILSLILKLAL